MQTRYRQAVSDSDPACARAPHIGRSDRRPAHVTPPTNPPRLLTGSTAEHKVRPRGKRFYAASLFEIEDGRIMRAVELWSDRKPAPAPEWRAPWTEPV